MLPEAEERNKEEKNAGENSPEGAFGEILHDVRIAFVFQIHPHEDEGAGQGHDADQTGSRWQSLADCRGNEDDGNAKNCFDQDLHSASSCPTSLISLSGQLSAERVKLGFSLDFLYLFCVSLIELPSLVSVDSGMCEMTRARQQGSLWPECEFDWVFYLR